MTVEYAKTVWVNNSQPYINADNLNNIEDGIAACADEINALSHMVGAANGIATLGPDGCVPVAQLKIDGGSA